MPQRQRATEATLRSGTVPVDGHGGLALAQVELPPEPASPSQARRFVADALRDVPVDTSLAVLLVSELVTNAVLHARTVLEVTVSTSPAGARVGVRDGSQQRPRLRHYDRQAPTGRGLHLLESLASRWGVDEDEHGKTVWFELAPSDGAGATTRRASIRRRLPRAPGLSRVRQPRAPRARRRP
jgi:hypothetical protein